VVHRSLTQKEVLLQSLSRIVATAIEISIGGEPTLLIAVYNAPGRLSLGDIDLLLGLGDRVVLAGDFNASTWPGGLEKQTPQET
jgi:hypothetical protein